MFGVDGSAGDSIAGVIIALGVLVTAIGSLVTAWQTRKTHGELRTLNESTLGSLANDAESRRVRAIDFADRTPKEQRHLDQSAPLEVVQGPVLADDPL